MELDKVSERKGGRSAKIRESVLNAARHLLREEGPDAVTQRNVALLAGVTPSTVYRRWPERAHLLTETLNSIADVAVNVPDTGCIRQDLERFLSDIAAMLTSADGQRLCLGILTAKVNGDEIVRESINQLWKRRFQQAEVLIRRALEREKIPAGVDVNFLTEMLVSPLWFRSFVSFAIVDQAFIARCVDNVLTLMFKHTS